MDGLVKPLQIAHPVTKGPELWEVAVVIAVVVLALYLGQRALREWKQR